MFIRQQDLLHTHSVWSSAKESTWSNSVTYQKWKILSRQSQESIHLYQQRTKNWYYRHRKDTSYAIGACVFVKVCTGRSKLDERWIEWCCTIEKSDEQTYFIQDINRNRKNWLDIHFPITLLSNDGILMSQAIYFIFSFPSTISINNESCLVVW